LPRILSPQFFYTGDCFIEKQCRHFAASAGVLRRVNMLYVCMRPVCRGNGGHVNAEFVPEFL